MSFNLPFSVYISNEAPIDGDRYVRTNQSERESLITLGRAHEGLQCYQQNNKVLYILKTLGVTPALSTWEAVGVGSGSTSSWLVSGNDITNINTGNVGIGGSPSAYKLDVTGTSRITSTLTVGSTITATGGNSTNWNTAYNWDDWSIGVNKPYIESKLTGLITSHTHNYTNNTGTVTSVTAGNGMTQTGTSSINPTLNVVSHGGTAGSIGTINIGSNAIGVNLGTTSTTAYRGDRGNTAYNNSINTNPTFNIGNGIITFTQLDATTLTVDLDGRYLTTAPTITLSGDVTGTGTSSIVCTVVNNSHLHTIANVTGLQTELNGKVNDTGNETIAGIKTFSSFPVTPSSSPTTNYQVANKKYVDDNIGGISFGNTGRLPYMNTGAPGTDFNYSSNLSFNGTILTVGDLTYTTKTYYKAISPLLFTTGSPDIDNVDMHGISIDANQDNVVFMCPVDLPHGATIISVIMHGSTSGKIWQLNRSPHSSTGISSVADATLNVSSSSITTPTVDNSTYSYYIFVYDIDNTQSVYGGSVTYTMNTI